MTVLSRGVVLVEDEAGLADLAPEWASLWSACPDATPFQHPSWLLPWWAAFGTGRPLVATWRDAGRLAGVLPAYVLSDGDGPKLLPMGAGTTDYLDALGGGVGEMVGALLARCASDGIRRFDWMDVPPGSTVPDIGAGTGWVARWHAGVACPVLTLDRVQPGALRKLRMNRNRAERAGGWTVEEAGPGGLETLVALHQARWTAAGEAGVLADPAVLGCLRAACPALAAAGLLRLQALRVGSVVAAACLALLAPGRIFFYASGYDAGQAFVSPGTLLVGAMLLQARAEGRTEAHFLRGREPYKYAWGAEDRWNRAGGFVAGAGTPATAPAIRAGAAR